MEDCEAFLRHEHAGLTRAAFLLSGDENTAQDLAQEVALRVLAAWPKVAAADSPSAYTRRMLINVYLRNQRRFWRREVAHAAPPDRAVPSGTSDVDSRQVLRAALMRLPARQRACVVLRHVEDQSEVQTAAALGVKVGTVKTLTSRGLASLRANLGNRAIADGHDEDGAVDE